MHSVKLTVLIEDNADLDMEVRVVAPDIPAAATATVVTAVPTGPVAVIKPRTVPVVPAAEDDYALGGYAGI